MKVAILDDYQDVAISCADWERLGPSVEIRAFRDPLKSEADLLEHLIDFDVIVLMRERTPFGRSVIESLPRLRLLVTTGMRNQSIDVEAAKAAGIVVSGTDSVGQSTVELTWALIMALVRNIPQELESFRGGGWQVGLGELLQGKTLGILGLGRLGTRVAALAQAFEMKTLAWSRNLTVERAEAAGVRLAASLDELLSEADVITIHLVLGDGTRGLIGRDQFAKMKETCYLVNASRGPIVNEHALVEALESRRIAGAAIDVFDTEPLPSDHPFRTLRNVVATPHIGYVSRENYMLFYGQVVEDIAAFAAGNPIRQLS
ncbi:2-hydroxyacid dehydrogenase [Agaricicola taiwanensis]|uniref:2-hydroxyacid dehydrogenase n=1 Tax=Agaricicola taiwanensis TaxID=591372 RepID=A0A8J2VLI9_9RHOB|nr:D-2-hydroxyacid dehydrogenase family protein [Agaricicola taiwanensis]GGE31724.1 2-hydroxyacid dehydrogenase [Agaricicola taiwanensis]